MSKFPVVYGIGGGILIAFVLTKFVFKDANLLLLLGCFALAMGTLVALFEIKEVPPGSPPVKTDLDV
ncbi:MAG: hypothetical protein ACYCVD_15290 [Desulfitobacteriaceae bacterium]